MGGKKKYIKMFGSFMDPFNFDSTLQGSVHIHVRWIIFMLYC